MHGLQERKVNVQGMVAVRLFDDDAFSRYVFSSADKPDSWVHFACCLRRTHMRAIVTHLLPNRNTELSLEKDRAQCRSTSRLRYSTQHHIQVRFFFLINVATKITFSAVAVRSY